MDVYYTFLVDFARPQRTNELLVMQDDNLTRIGRFILMNNGTKMDITNVDTCTVNAILPDETRITAEATLATDEDGNQINEILFPIPQSMTSAVGKTVVTITLYHVISTTTTDVEKVLSSFEFYINTRNELNRDDSSGDDEYAGIRDLINKALEAVDLVDQMIAREAMPNPYPLKIILEGDDYNYDGSESVIVNLGTIISRITALELAFPAGCRIIARAITAGRGTYTNPINGVSTADNAAPATMAANIKTLAQNNYNQGVTDTKDINPTFSTAWSTRTSGTEATYQTKTATAGWTDANEEQQTLTSKVTAQINTTADDGTHNFNVVPDAYHKVKVNQKPAYDAGYSAGYTAGYGEARTGYSFASNQGFGDRVTKFLAKGTYAVNAILRGYGEYQSYLTITKSNGGVLYEAKTSKSSTGNHELFSGSFTIGANAYVTISWQAINSHSGFVAGGIYKV